ncbi:hypothetical protein BDQ17DRAFT_1536274 [Cyathus striatus]|nr:hypothetical protein BDQ17DRAFT_1536274 [Cyathus striatus]
MRRPTTTVTYTFAPQTIPANSMILAAPSYVTSFQQPYYISVNMNCFTPSSYITTIRRRSWDGEVVGDFELGLTRRTATVCIRGNEQPMNELLESGYRLFRNNHQTWSWKIGEHDKVVTLYWEETPEGLSCFSSKDKIAASLLAKFIPPKYLRKQGRIHESTRLQVTSSGHEYLDDIVISVLVIERLRTSPTIWPLAF